VNFSVFFSFIYFFSVFLHGDDVTPLKYLLKKEKKRFTFLFFHTHSSTALPIVQFYYFGLYSSSTYPVHVPSPDSRYSSTDQWSVAIPTKSVDSSGFRDYPVNSVLILCLLKEWWSITAWDLWTNWFFQFENWNSPIAVAVFMMMR
jgi:hypothetical protein